MVLIYALTACVASIHPLYTAEDLVTDARIPGTWVESGSDGSEGSGGLFSPGNPGAIWSFTMDKDSSYKLTYTADSISNTFKVHLLELNGHCYVDFYPEDDNIEVTDLMIVHLLPVHTFAKVVITKDELRLYSLNSDFIMHLPEQQKTSLKHEATKDSFILTASTEELQKFVIRYAGEEEAFHAPRILKRK